MEKLNWDEYFMILSKASALRSKDPNTKVGACIVNKKNRVIALGYNGMPMGNDNDFTWDSKKSDRHIGTKYDFVIHAEINAVLNATTSISGSKLYTSLFPCSNCAKTLVQSGINEIIYESDKYNGTDDDILSKYIFDTANVKYRKILKIDLEIKK